MTIRAVFLMGVALLAGCGIGQPWGLTFYNNHGFDSLLVRVDSDAGSNTWLLQPQQMDILLLGGQQRSGSLTLLDPDSCEVLATSSFDPEPGLVVLASRGVTGDGPWEVVTFVEEPGE